MRQVSSAASGVYKGQVIGFAVFFPQTEACSNGMLNKASYPGFGVFCGLMGSVAMLLCVFGTRSAIPNLRPPVSHANERNTFWAFIDVFKTLRLSSFRILFIAVLIFNTLAGPVQTLLVYCLL